MHRHRIIITAEQPQQIMVTKKYSINTDKLKLCYRIPQDYDLFNYIIEHSGIADLNAEDIEWKTQDTKVFFGAEDFYFSVIDFVRNEKNEIIKIVCAVMLPDHTKLGDFEISSTSFVGKAFFTFTNRSLYTIFTNVCGVKHNNTIHLQYIADCLGLSFNNVTNIEIAIDCNFNIIKKVRDYIASQKYFTFLNGKKIKDSKIHFGKPYQEYKGRCEERVDTYPTIRIKQSDGLKLTIYNKTFEMEVSNQGKEDYIPEWNGFGDTDGKEQIYRVEVYATREDIRDFYGFLSDFRPEWNEPDLFLNHLGIEDFRALLWHWCTHRMLFFRDKTDTTNTDIDLIDLL